MLIFLCSPVSCRGCSGVRQVIEIERKSDVLRCPLYTLRVYKGGASRPGPPFIKPGSPLAESLPGRGALGLVVASPC